MTRRFVLRKTGARLLRCGRRSNARRPYTRCHCGCAPASGGRGSGGCESPSCRSSSRGRSRSGNPGRRRRRSAGWSPLRPWLPGLISDNPVTVDAARLELKRSHLPRHPIVDEVFVASRRGLVFPPVHPPLPKRLEDALRGEAKRAELLGVVRPCENCRGRRRLPVSCRRLRADPHCRAGASGHRSRLVG